MTLEDHPVEHRQTADDPVPMNILERAHGAPPRPQRPAKSPAEDARAQGRVGRPDTDTITTGPALWLRPSAARLR